MRSDACPVLVFKKIYKILIRISKRQLYSDGSKVATTSYLIDDMNEWRNEGITVFILCYMKLQCKCRCLHAIKRREDSRSFNFMIKKDRSILLFKEK